MNLKLTLKRAMRRPTWVAGRGTKLGWHGDVLNASTSSDSIHVGRHCHIDGELFVFAHGGAIRMGTGASWERTLGSGLRAASRSAQGS